MNAFFRKMRDGFVVSGALILLAAGCGKPHYKISGEIDGADKEPVTLERANFNGQWIVVDSTRTSSSGKFEFSGEPFGHPEILRIALNGNYIYLPLDSIETLKITTQADNFAGALTVEGSDQAVAMAELDKELRDISPNLPQDSLDKIKRGLFANYMQPYPGSLISYYLLTKEYGGKPLFNPYEGEDYKYFAAVATGYRQMRPNDPRTPLLEATGLEALKNKNKKRGAFREFSAEEIGFINISLPDENGETRNLSEIAGNGKPTVLIFSLLTTPDSPALNLELNNLLRSKNIEIYQVSLDPDRYVWREAAKNLPWVTVYDSDGEYSSNVAAYNVFEVPAFFIIDASGALSDRALTIEELKRKL